MEILYLFCSTIRYIKESCFWNIFVNPSVSQKRQNALTKFQNFEKIILNHVELDAYCKYTYVFMNSIRKTYQTSRSREFFEKYHFSKISLNENIYKNGIFKDPWHGNVIYYIQQHVLLRNSVFETFLEKRSFSIILQRPPLVVLETM
jgi:hypothetical protein